MIEMDISVLEGNREESKFQTVRRWRKCWKKRSENTGQKKDESRKKRASERGDTVALRDNERDSFSLGDERREGRRENSGRGGKPKGELDIYIGDSRLCTKENPFKSRIARTRPRRIRRG